MNEEQRHEINEDVENMDVEIIHAENVQDVIEGVNEVRILKEHLQFSNNTVFFL